MAALALGANDAVPGAGGVVTNAHVPVAGAVTALPASVAVSEQTLWSGPALATGALMTLAGLPEIVPGQLNAPALAVMELRT